MDVRATAKSRMKQLAKRVLRPFAPQIRGVLGRADSHLVEVSTHHFRETNLRIDDLTRQIDEIVRVLRDPNAPIESVHDLRHSVAHVREMVLGLGERVHSQQVMLDELQFRVERLAGSALDGMALDRRLQNLEDRVLARRD